MGAQISSQKQQVESIVKSATDVIIQNFSSCGASSQTSQNISFGSVGGDFNISGVTQSSAQNVTAECVSKTSNNADILNQITQKLAQEAQSKVGGLTLGLAKANQESIQKSVVDVTNSINMSTVRQNMAAAIASQNISANSVAGSVNISNVNQTVAQAVVLKSLMDDSNVTTAANKLATDISQASKLEIAGISFSFSTAIAIVAVIICVLFCCVGGFILLEQ